MTIDEIKRAPTTTATPGAPSRAARTRTTTSRSASSTPSRAPGHYSSISARCVCGAPKSCDSACARLKTSWASCSQVMAIPPCSCTVSAAIFVEGVGAVGLRDMGELRGVRGVRRRARRTRPTRRSGTSRPAPAGRPSGASAPGRSRWGGRTARVPWSRPPSCPVPGPPGRPTARPRQPHPPARPGLGGGRVPMGVPPVTSSDPKRTRLVHGREPYRALDGGSSSARPASVAATSTVGLVGEEGRLAGYGERRHLAGRDPRKQPLLGFVGPAGQQGLGGDERGRRGEGASERPTSSSTIIDSSSEKPGAVVVLGDRQGGDADLLAQGPPERLVVPGLRRPSRTGPRPGRRAGEQGADRGRQLLLLLGEREIHQTELRESRRAVHRPEYPTRATSARILVSHS